VVKDAYQRQLNLATVTFNVRLIQQI